MSTEKALKAKKRLYSAVDRYGATAADYLCIAGLFSIFGYFNWVSSGSEIPYDVLWKLVLPFQNFMSQPALMPVIKSGWGVSGRQFFLFPLLAAFGTDPFTLKAIQVAGYAFLGPVIYLALSRKFDRYTGLSGGLLFISFRLVEKWRNGDVYLALLAMMLMLYTYVLWEKSDEIDYVYLLGFIAGFGIYIKTMVVYPVIGLLLATLILEHEKVREMGSKSLLKFSGFFLLGLSPLLIYGVSNGFVNSSLMWTLKNLPGLQHAFITRYHQFNRITAAGGPIARGVNQQSLHLYTLLFTSGAAISIYRKRDLVYLLAMPITMFASFISPKGTLPVHQLMGLYPFFLVILSQNLVELKDIKGLHRLAPVAVICILYLTSGYLHVSDVHPGSVTTEEFRDFQQLETGKVVGTNSRHLYAITVLDPDTSARIAASSNSTFKYFISRKDRLAPEDADNADAGSWLLIKQHHCKKLFYGAERCGFSTGLMREKIGAEPGTAKNVTIGRYDYIFIRTGN